MRVAEAPNPPLIKRRPLRRDEHLTADAVIEAWEARRGAAPAGLRRPISSVGCTKRRERQRLDGARSGNFLTGVALVSLTNIVMIVVLGIVGNSQTGRLANTITC
jgi:hypothetical protein